MTTPDLFTTVGFEKSKIGANDTELGYAIKKTRLIGLVVGSLGCLGFVALIGVWSIFEIHLERRDLHRELRKEEHHAASKLAQVGMELWSEYRADIQESHEAQMMLKSLNMSYESFQAKMKTSVGESAKSLGVSQEKAAKLADTLLQLVADHQKQNLKGTKKLVDTLVDAGKRAVKLEKRAEHEVMKEIKVEEKALEEDLAKGEALPEETLPEGENNKTEAEDPLKGILDGFFYIFHDYEREFSGKPRELMKPGNKVFDALKDLYNRIPELGQDKIGEELDKIDLASIGAPLGEGRILPAGDIVEELIMISEIPHKELEELYKAWQDGTEDSVMVFSKVSEWHKEHKVPSGWLQMGVDEDEKEEMEREDEEEKEEAEHEAEEEAENPEHGSVHEHKG